ncbi:hypothetical protein JKP88DRAFT_29770 [Tribonema minus]|uniref:Uncharacterized protein n=1 Tax=Tribonema minus TaxID=303371 RepID=A0A835Z769_9STRA|nr:hypothetical protein JKP88DRAFT_29770 [Tribonema minus]
MTGKALLLLLTACAIAVVHGFAPGLGRTARSAARSTCTAALQAEDPNGNNSSNIFSQMLETPEQREARKLKEKENAAKWAKLILAEAKKPDSQQTFNKTDLILIPVQVLGFLALVNFLGAISGKTP